MIIQRYLGKEILQTLAAVTAVLLLIFLGWHFGRFLAQAAAGEIASDIVLELLLYFGIGSLGVIIPFSLYIAVLLSFARLHKDSEMTALAACGIGIRQVMKIVVAIAVPGALLVAGLTLYVMPWAAQQSAQVQERSAASAEIDAVGAAQFNLSGGRVFYVESLSDDRTRLENVFLQKRQDGKLIVYSAPSGYQYTDPDTGLRYLVLVDGFRYDGFPGEQAFTLQEYAKGGVLIEERPAPQQRRRREAIDTATLFDNPSLRNTAEWQWRLSMPLSLIVLAALGTLLGQGRPRAARGGTFFAAIIGLIIYNNALAVARNALEQGTLPPLPGLWLVHGVMLIVVLALYGRQAGWWRARPRRVAPA